MAIIFGPDGSDEDLLANRRRDLVVADVYRQHRTTMLAWKVRYDKGEMVDNEPFALREFDNDAWDTCTVQEDYGLIGITTKIIRGGTLTPAIDGARFPANDSAWTLTA